MSTSYCATLKWANQINNTELKVRIFLPEIKFSGGDKLVGWRMSLANQTELILDKKNVSASISNNS